MGEKIKILGSGKISDSEYEIELNNPLAPGKEQQVHIQTSNFRIELEMKDFIKYGLAILVAGRNLKQLKNIK